MRDKIRWEIKKRKLLKRRCKVEFPRSRNFYALRRVNKIEAVYESSRVNVKGERGQLLASFFLCLWHCNSPRGLCESELGPVSFSNGVDHIRQLRNEKGTGAEMRPAICSWIVTGDALVSYWSSETFPEVLRELNSDHFSFCF